MKVLVILLAALAALVCVGETAQNVRPIIGIMTQPTGSSLSQYGDKYIAASYVKYIESAGARVVAVQHDAPQDVLDTYFNNLNGLLLPGGDADLDNTTLYLAGQYFYDRALQAYDQGDYFPIMGHCMGFEMLTIITSQNFDILQPVDCENISLPLSFTDDAFNSRMFGKAPVAVQNIFENEAVTMNNHQFSLYPTTYSKTDALNSFYHVLSQNYDRQGQEFISSMEGKKYPIFAIQWHAEKPLYEWNPNEAMNHSPDAIQAMQYMANTFVSQARQSTHSFPSTEDENDSVIYNTPPVYTFNSEADFEQCYFFDKWQ